MNGGVFLLGAGGGLYLVARVFVGEMVSPRIIGTMPICESSEEGERGREMSFCAESERSIIIP